MYHVFPILAQADEGGLGGPGSMQFLVTIGAMLVLMYFILWRPEAKRRKDLDRKRDALKQGDRVIAMGIVGTVQRLEEHTIIVKMHDGSKLEFLKSAISDVDPDLSKVGQE